MEQLLRYFYMGKVCLHGALNDDHTTRLILPSNFDKFLNSSLLISAFSLSLSIYLSILFIL